MTKTAFDSIWTQNFIYIYIYIYIERERERERDDIFITFLQQILSGMLLLVVIVEAEK